MSTDLDDIIRRDDDLYDLKGAREEAALANGGRPQSLAGRLDVLAQMPGRENAPEVQRDGAPADTDHAAPDETAEDDAGGSPPADAAQDERQPASAGTPKADPEKIALLEKLRLKARQGTKKLRLFLATVSEAEEALLTDADRRSLEAIAEDSDARAD